MSEEEKDLAEQYLYKNNIANGAKNVQSGDFKITEKYERKNYVDYAAQKKMDAFKEKQFGDSEVYVNKYGQELHKNATDTIHNAQTDHKVASDRAHQYAKDSGLKHITDEDIKRAINRESNYELISERWNKAKRNKSDKEFAESKSDKVVLTEAQKAQLKQTSLIGDIMVNSELHLVNAGKGLIDNASQSAATAASANLLALVNGDKNLTEAAVDTVVDTIKLDAKRTGTKVATSVAQGGLKKIEEGLAKEIGKKGAKQVVSQAAQRGVQFVSENLGSIVQVGVMLGDSIIKYANGEIETEELMIDVGGAATVLTVNALLEPAIKEATSKIAAAIGTAVAGPVGTAIGAAVGMVVGELVSLIVSSVVSKGVLAFKQVLQAEKIHKKKVAMIDRISKQAIADIRQRRKSLKATIQREFAIFDRSVEKGFNQLYNSLMENDVDGVTEGLTIILSIVNPNVKFESKEEFKKRFRSKDEFTITV